MIGPVPACISCKHNHDWETKDFSKGWVCDAYPDGIPDEIIIGGNPHTDYIIGDHGIKYIPRH
jgi:hypothetical protein